jgi:PelA/Pel-15E family pectate lyase
MNLRLGRVLLVLLASTLAIPVAARAAPASKVDVSKLLAKPDAWFTSDDGRRMLDNIVSWQNANGGWWKGYAANVPRDDNLPLTDDYSKAPPGDNEAVWRRTSTFDNKATVSELRLLARAFRLTQEPKYRQAFERGMKFVFDSQYPGGGWPQRFPLENNYGRFITYNDNAIVGIMTLLLDIDHAEGDFAWASPEERARANQAFDRGVRCILDTQIKVDGRLTGWCQQHDDKTLAPATARTYELPSIAASETASILRLLMRMENPDDRVKTAIRSGAAWLERSKLTGVRIVDKPDPALPHGRDEILVEDAAAAQPLWARFYDIETNRPFYCGRDGVKKWSLGEVEPERRAGYSWVRPFGRDALKAYQKWAAKHGDGDAAAAGN